MLARVLKSGAAQAVAPLRVPVVSDTGEPLYGSGVHSYEVPELEPPDTFLEPVAFVPEGASAEDMLSHAEAEAARIIAQAEEHAAIIEQVASDKAVHKAKAELAAETAGELGEMRKSLAASVAELAVVKEKLDADLERELVEFAVAIARKIVMREVTIDREIVLALVKVALTKLHSRVDAAVHLNPLDLPYVSKHLDSLGYRGRIELIEDQAITAGGVMIHTETGDVDARIESQLDEIAYGLLN